MDKFEAFVRKYDLYILNIVTVLFVIPMLAFAINDDVLTALAILGGYFVFGAIFSFINNGYRHRIHPLKSRQPRKPRHRHRQTA